MTIINGTPCHSRCGTLKKLHCSMAMSAENNCQNSAMVTICVKNPRLGQKPNKQTQSVSYLQT